MITFVISPRCLNSRLYALYQPEIHALPTSSIFVAQVRKSPNIGQIHREANDRQEKVYFLAPSFSVVLEGSGRTCEAARGRNDGGTGVLDAILVLHQYQFYLLFFHIALFERGHRRELVFWQNLDIHLLCGAYEAHADPVLSRPPAGSGGGDGLSRCAWIRTAIPLTKTG